MGYIKKLEGKHIYLAVPKVEDAATYVKWLSDFDTTDGLGNSAMIMTVEAEEAWIDPSRSHELPLSHNLHN